MVPEKLELHLAQTESLIDTIMSLTYSDPRKEHHKNQLVELFQAIKSSDYRSLSTIELNNLRRCIDYYLVSDAEFLADSSDHSLVPNELLYCANTVLKDWISDSDDYIIVTSNLCKFNGYSFQAIPESQLVIIEPFIRTRYGIEFENKLLQLNVPQLLAGDFLANVVIYHEIGHFIDRRFKIIDKLFATSPRWQHLLSTDKMAYYRMLQYYKEFFADLFAAQYIGSSCASYLSYFFHNADASFTHPQASDRIQLVKRYLEGTSDPIINEIQQYTKVITGKFLQSRHKVPVTKFEDLKPIAISSIEEVHGLFISGWNYWTNTENAFRANPQPNLKEEHKHINKLIALSISGYVTSEQAQVELTSNTESASA